MSQIERKSIELIALRVKGVGVRSMQRFISDIVWNEPAMIRKHHDLVDNDMGDPSSVLIFDESGYAKKGEDSAGVAKQYCETLGKAENCQVGSFAAYACPQDTHCSTRSSSCREHGSRRAIKIKERNAASRRD